MAKIHKKIQTIKYVNNEKGLLGLGIVGLEYLQKKSRKRQGSKSKHTINTGAPYTEVLSFDINKPANYKWQAPKVKKSFLTVNWLMPPPGKGSGGHYTLFRFIKSFEEAGHVCRIYFHMPGKGSSVSAVRNAMDSSFPEVKAEMHWLQNDQEMQIADIIFATSWQTAYTVYGSKLNAKKFYFIQDFEPYFYPVGGHSVLAENTYRMGLRGISAGGWLKNKISQEYGMNIDKFDFGLDSNIYKYENNQVRKEITYYARPTTPRRAFELGITTLDIFSKLHPDYTINFIGWDVSDYKIPFKYKNLGILTHEQLNSVYNKSAASLVLSLTNMSLLPLELLGSGCIPVVNDGDNNRLVSNNEYIRYSLADPMSLANALSLIVSNKQLPLYSKKAALSVKACTWKTSCDTVINLVEQSYYKNKDL